MSLATTFIWDTTGPLYATLSENLDWLLDAAGPERTHALPTKVEEEISHLAGDVCTERFHSLNCEEVDTIEDFVELNEWFKVLGADPKASGRNVGEAFVAFFASKDPESVAVIDDSSAVTSIGKTGKRVSVHGVLWAISQGVVEGRVPSPNAYSGLVESMLSVKPRDGMGPLRWPRSLKQGGFAAWYTENEKALRKR